MTSEHCRGTRDDRGESGLDKTCGQCKIAVPERLVNVSHSPPKPIPAVPPLQPDGFANRFANRRPHVSRRLTLVFAVVAVPVLLLLVGSRMKSEPVTASNSSTTESPSAAAWRLVKNRRIYFAHQSVGENLLAGLRQLAQERQDADLKIVETRSPTSVAGAGIVHFKAGRNTDPSSKNRDFLAVLDARSLPDSAIAMLKYCYVDMLLQSDVDQLFAEYQRTIATIRQRHSDIAIVHSTMPLTTPPTGIRAFANQLLGRDTERALNVKRNAYNALLRNAYAGKEPVFDLAEIESTRPDGTRSYFTSGGNHVYTLAPEYTSDGGHLNEVAQRRAASILVRVLADARSR